ncbi:uncharacterized protein LOC127871618 isoform X2 [Dreissena polymorpha]|nr:uncharacterized protein LOC127871618 isoform X2 [Dreissena polymorpha]XP_052270679.1 uncharacterized protein LOC127871618 isoform X2 [Dreissena polymorpha]XP_052270680.1 uncharacterized protein LOC127871618 isoform X2 [Dreissena polymorpha]XP_052270682.1 uncharacterized protein LOC127871618 isoform X2 [Dreissena polymorpha]XP_052270683.1 uncharacterized protein LOC127871618 isoform X2 [Dreissena polymorpha]
MSPDHILRGYIVCMISVITIQPSFASLVTELFTKIESLQVHHDEDFRVLPLTWQAQRGMYPSEVKLNFHGDEQYYFARDAFKVPDINMFTTAWVTTCLLEAHAYGKSPKPTIEKLLMSLDAIKSFSNANENMANSEMTFWPQKLNQTAKYYQSTPRNLFEVLSFPDYLPNKLIEELLEKLGLKDLEHIYEMLVREKDMYAVAFHIPPDFDDTFVNIGLGSLLGQLGTEFPSPSDLWRLHNTNISTVFDKLKRYAYRPMSGIDRVNTIDPRTYMYMRSFLEDALTQQQDVAIVPTWLQDTDEVRVLFDKGVAMPFSVNNIDVTVCANFLYGMVTCIGNNVCPVDLIDPDVQKIFMNTTALVAHEIKVNLSSRPDLALTYYPSKFEFYWFVTRSYAWLNRFLAQKASVLPSDTYEMLKYAHDTLGPVLTDHMTSDLLTSVQHAGDGCYVDDFLGNSDMDFSNKSMNRAEDRIFTTAVTINALINTYTTWENGSLHWERGTPASVRSSVECLIKWLTGHVLFSQYKPWNAFFSGSGKGAKSMPFFYPANRMEYFNGTKFTDKSFPADIHNIIGMQAVVSTNDYNAMLLQPHFGKVTPTTFNGYNSEPGMFFPFWTSDAYTFATSLVAVSHFENIVN